MIYKPVILLFLVSIKQDSNKEQIIKQMGQIDDIRGLREKGNVGVLCTILCSISVAFSKLKIISKLKVLTNSCNEATL